MKLLCIPDTQVRPGIDLSYLHDIGEYWIDKKPDVVVHLGDHWDFPSLSSYDQGKMAFEGRRYKADVFAGNLGMQELTRPLVAYNAKQRSNGKKQYWPRQVFLLGNHENRVERAVNDDAKLEGTIGYHDLDLNGWEVHPFLEVVVIEGVAFSHYFTTGVMGRPATTASALLAKKHMSCIQGHQQGRQVASGFRADGNQITAIIAGSCLAPHHKVLTADLRYVELGSVNIGDKLVSFDEELGEHSKRSRRFKTGTVTNLRKSTGEMFKVTLSSGKVFYTTADHRWLTKNCMGVTKWQETQNLTVHKNHVNQNTKIGRVMPEWEEELSKDAGWLAGMYDGEGSLYARKTTGGNCTQLSITQCPVHNPGTVKELDRLHSKFNFNMCSGSHKNQTCKEWRIKGGQQEVARFLGSIRPSRLLSKFSPELLGTLTTQYNTELDVFLSVESVGQGDYIEIEIDAKTMVVEGYPHHNCYPHQESYMGPQGNKHWRGVIMLHNVDNGSFDECFVPLTYLSEKYGSKSKSVLEGSNN